MLFDAHGLPLTATLHGRLENGIARSGLSSLLRPEGERTPIHYHETPQMFCLRQGKILVKREGYPDTMYEPPACYVMEAYIKMATISLVGDKVEDCLLRKQHGDFNWVVLEPDYLHLQNQWWS